MFYLAMFLGICFVLFTAGFIDVSSVRGDEEEMEKIRKARQENPKNVYFIFIALAITVLNILLIPLAPNKPTAGSGLEIFYETMSFFALFLYFSAVYFFGKKLVLTQPQGEDF